MPLHDRGKWIWNGYEITHQGVTADGEPWRRKGQWTWVSEDTKNGWMATASAQEIQDYYKPKSYEEVGAVIGVAIVILGVICAITMGALMLL
jgi:hypothetical protein